MSCRFINKMVWLRINREMIFKVCTATTGSRPEAKSSSALLKHSQVLHAFLRGDTNFHLIKVHDVSRDTKPDKLIHKSITYYHKLLSERRLQLDPRQSMLRCLRSHSNIGDISIVTESFSVALRRFSSSHWWPTVRQRVPPVFGSYGRQWLNRPEALLCGNSHDMMCRKERF